MAANFWTSSHYKQILEQEEVDVVHPPDKEKGLSLEDVKLIKMQMANCLRSQHLLNSMRGMQLLGFSREPNEPSITKPNKTTPGEYSLELFQHTYRSGMVIVVLCVKGVTWMLMEIMQHIADISKLAQYVKVRQRVIATAVTYMRRVYTRKSMTEYDPRLVAPTCLYLASKAEESTVQARLLVFYIKKQYNDEKYRFEIKDILEMEMKILEALNYYLVVYHPYHPLSQLLQDAGMTELTQLSWGLVNDTYKMDFILIYPPYMIALACIFIASVLKEKDTTAWFEELRADMNVVKNISMELLDFYDGQKGIPDERIQAAFHKLNVQQQR